MTRTMTRIGAALLGLILTAAAALSLMIPAVADEPTDTESWMQIAQTIVADLDAGVAEYADGDHAGAASAFNVAYNTDYVASNFAKVVNDTIGADRYQNQRRQFQDLQRLVYQQNRRTDIESLRDALADDVRECGAMLDGNGELSDPRDYARMREEQTAKEREALDAAKVHKNEGIGTRSWSDVATEMVSVLDDSLAASESGDGERGAELVNEAYYQYYEKLGFEKNVMNAIGGSRVSKVESTFKESRKAMVAGDAADAKAHVDELKTMLVEDAAALDGGAGSEVGGFTRLITSSFGQAFLILIREGLEALLVVAAIIAYLVKSGNRRLVRWIYLGVVAGLAASGVIAAVFMALFGGSGPQQEIMEGVCALVAMGMLLYTSNWMLNKSSVDAWNRYIRAKTEAAVARIGGTAGTDPTPERLGAAGIVSLALLSFLAVFREGAETVIFYQSIYSMTQDAGGMWIGGITAAVVLIGVFLLIRFTSVRIPIRPFFIVTSVLLAVLVVIFAGGGVHSLIEGDALGGIYLDGFPTNDWLGLYPYVETLAAQGIALAAVLALFAIGAARQAKTRRAEQMA